MPQAIPLLLPLLPAAAAAGGCAGGRRLEGLAGQQR